jgi:carbon monoxide dehydrogenase subunit G
MIIEGKFAIQAPIQQVWSFLVDLERVSACMPGVEKVSQTDDKTYNGTVTVKVGPIGTSFQGNVVKTEEQAPNLLKARLQGRDAKTASMVTGEFVSELSETADGQTEVNYKFDIAIRGHLGQFGQAVILDTARQLTDEFVACVRARIERPEALPEVTAPKSNPFWVVVRAFFANLWASIKRLFRKT